MMDSLGQLAQAQSQAQFKHIPVVYIVALGDPGANSGSGAELWGCCQQDYAVLFVVGVATSN